METKWLRETKHEKPRPWQLTKHRPPATSMADVMKSTASSMNGETSNHAESHIRKPWYVQFSVYFNEQVAPYKVRGFVQRKLTVQAGWPYKRVIAYHTSFYLGATKNWPYIQKGLVSVDHISRLNCNGTLRTRNLFLDQGDTLYSMPVPS